MHNHSMSQTSLLSDFLFRIEMLNNNDTMTLKEKKETFLFFCSKRVKKLDTPSCISLYQNYTAAFNNQPKPSLFKFIYTPQIKTTSFNCCYCYLLNQQKSKPKATKTHKYFLGYIKATLLHQLQEYAYQNDILDPPYAHTLNTVSSILKTPRGNTANLYIKFGWNKGYQGKFNRFYQTIKQRLPYHLEHNAPAL